MTRTRPITFLAGAAVVPLIALVAAGCGGGSDGAASATAPPTTATGQPATVGVADEDNLGSILVESRGRTLYLFQKDSGTRSACYGACAQDWPPLRATGQPTTGSEADASLIGTSARSDGKPQLTYNDHPLYLFSGDTEAGDLDGQGSTAFGGAWFALSPAGDAISSETSSSSDGSSSGGGYGY
jgi:predicted lipoprotein with Yx(FWY)xxD motif